MFVGLNAPLCALIHKDGVWAIMTGSLIAIIHGHLHTGDGVPGDITHILKGQISPLGVVVPTSADPVFDAEMQDPSNGYRPIGSLANIQVRIETPALSITSPTRWQEIDAVHSSSHPKTPKFLNYWSHFGVNLETHFILILHNIAAPSTISTISHSPLSTSSDLSFGCFPSPLTNFDSNSSRNSPVTDMGGITSNSHPLIHQEVWLTVEIGNLVDSSFQDLLGGAGNAIWPAGAISLNGDSLIPPFQLNLIPTCPPFIYGKCNISQSLRNNAMFQV